jgi:hypothetical protein
MPAGAALPSVVRMTSPAGISLADLLLIAAAVVWILARQVTRQPVKPRLLVVVPLLLGYAGLRAVPGQLWHTPADVALVGVGALVAVGLGLVRGTTIRVWHEADGWWRRGTRTTLLLWGALLGVRLVLAVADRATGHPEASGAGVLLCSLALSFAAQNAVVLARTMGAVTSLPLAHRAPQV